MADRTVKIYGKAYGSSDVNVEITFNNTVVFNQTVATNDEAVNQQIAWEDNQEWGSFTISTDLSGEVPLSIEVTGGDGAVWHTFQANYMGAQFDDAVRDANGNPTLSISTEDNYQDLSGLVEEGGVITGDGRTDVIIDSVSEEWGPETGTRNFYIPAGTILTCTYRVQPALLGDTWVDPV